MKKEKSSLSIEYRRRIDRWVKQLGKSLYTKSSSITLRGFESEDFFTLESAKKQHLREYPPGEKWGEPWTYGYFFGEIEIDEKLEGKNLVFRPDTGKESLVYVNGKAVGAKDIFHFNIPLTGNAKRNDRFEIFIETYAGHGERNGHVGPVADYKVTVPDPEGKQAQMGKNRVCIWNEEAYLLWIEINALLDIRDKNPQDSLRVYEIDRLLKDFTLTVDFEHGDELFNQTVKECRKKIKPAFEKTNSSSTPTMYMFGHSHLDVAWKWPINETKRKCARTFSNQLSLIEEYDEYIFMGPQPYLYELLKDNYPQIYSRAKDSVKQGRIVPDGALYVESDTNIPCGESLIRQFMYGKEFFKQEFGKDSRLCWLPDAFGFSASFPQIMAGCNVDYFATSKLLWIYNDGDKFPFITFNWQGADGSRILSHNHNEYNAHSRPSFVYDAWKSMHQKEGLRSRLMPFGYGDGGGGALRDHMEFLKLEKDLEGIPKTKISPPEDFFIDLEKDIRSGYSDLPTYVGELYLQAHRGVYTTQSRTKKENRRCEIALREVEFWNAVSLIEGKPAIKTKEIRDLWKKILVNQFHDILPGTSIKRVYDDALEDYGYVQGQTGQLLDSIYGGLGKGKGFCVFNSLGWPRRELVEIPPQVACLHPEICQKISSKSYAMVQVPSGGYISIEEAMEKEIRFRENSGNKGLSCKAGDGYIENDLIRVYYSPSGEITKISDKQSGEILSGEACNKFRMYKDVPSMFDAWDIDSMYSETEFELSCEAETEIVSQGDSFVCIKVKRKLNKSLLEQDIILRQGSKRIDFKTVIDWRERHKLLKVDFDTGVLSELAMHNIQYGYIQRPTHQNRQFDSDRFETCAQRWTAMADNDFGAAVLNDCKYGVSTYGSTISLSLLRSPLAPDMYADKGIHEFTYSYLVWEGPFKDSLISRHSYNLNVPLNIIGGISLPEKSYFEIDSPNIVLDTLKPAEDGKGIILRIYDMMNMKCNVKIKTKFNFKKIFETDMLENNIREIESDSKNSVFGMEVKNFKVVTLRIVL